MKTHASIFSTFLVAMSMLLAEDSSLPETAMVAKTYAKLMPMTKQAVYVNPQFMLLCAGTHSSHVEQAAKRDGPHANTAIMVFMNETAAQAFKARSKRYPAGSVIVKEKRNLGHYDPEVKKEVKRGALGVGGMIKRSAGFDPANGDWEYFYFDDVKKLESGKIRSCIDCHAKAADTGDVLAAGANRLPTDTFCHSI